MTFNTQRGATFHISGYVADDKNGPTVGVSFWGGGISVTSWLTAEEAHKLAAIILHEAERAEKVAEGAE